MDKPKGNAGRARGRAEPKSPSSADRGRGRGAREAQPTPSGSQAASLKAVAAPVVSAWGNPNVGGARGISRGVVVAAPSQQMPIAQQRPPAAETLEPPSTNRADNRGAVRGRRVVTELVHSRPRDLKSKCGVTGEKVCVQTNYFTVLKTPKWSIHQYRVDFSPDVEMIHMRRSYLSQNKALFGGYVFDGTVLFCTKFFMDQANNGQKEILVKNAEGEPIQIKIRHVGIVDVTDIEQIQVLNLILRRAVEGLQLQLVGRNYFDPSAKIVLDSYKIELWPGYQTSIRQHERDILLCAEITHKVMRTQTIHQIISVYLLETANFEQKVKQKLVGMVVLTDYNNKTYRIDDVDFNSSPSSKFEWKNKKVSYVDYYSIRYNLKIHDMKQPLLVSRPTERNIRGGQNEFIMLIPELCRATGLDDEMRSNFKLMRAMSDHTRLNPDRRIERLKTFNKRLHSSKVSMEVFSQWNMKMETNLVEGVGRKLPGEKIIFGKGTHFICDKNADWTREFRNRSMYYYCDIRRWFVIVPKRNVKEVQDFVKMCIKAASFMKMVLTEPDYIEISDFRDVAYSQAIEQAKNKDPQILMIVLVTNSAEIYSCIKKKCCADFGIPSQACTLRTIAPRSDKSAGLMSVASKIVIQMAAKLMGAPWMIDLPLKGLMTVGFDVCHSPKDTNKSYGALVATMDIKLSTKYFSSVTEHMKGQELSNEIGVKMLCALKAYRDTHGTLPERILFYRDGVGDTQLHQVFRNEIRYLKQKLDATYKSAGIEKGCRFTFIVVSKRINTRYFVKGQNPEPGTIVDDIITLPERYDFFLVSQSVRQGTVSPTSYNVLYDNSGLSPDRIQILTYKMTHLYYNWSGTVRVPAVCQYAHKLAFLVAESVHRVPNSLLENKLYFL